MFGAVGILLHHVTNGPRVPQPEPPKPETLRKDGTNA
jgi:hypothetical protein